MDEKTKVYIDDMIKSELGNEIAERRKESEEKGKNKPDDDFLKVMADPKSLTRPSNKDDRGMDAARMMKCLATAFARQKDGKYESPMDVALKMGFKHLAAGIEKAMGESTIASGGALVPDEWSTDFIELLHDIETVASLGARMIPVPRGKLPIPKGTTGVTAYWVGESANITPSTPQTGVVNLTPHKVAGIVAQSNELIADSSDASTRFIRDEMLNALAEAKDLKYIRGLGTADSPKGMRYHVDSGNAFGATMAGAASTLAEVTGDTVKLLYLVLLDLKNQIRKPGWIWNPRTWYYLFSLLDSNGNPAFRDELKGGTYFGAPFKMTTQIPINLGGATNESEVYYADFDRLMIGFTGGLEIAASNVAAYYDGSSVVAAFSKDETVIKGTQRVDFQPRYAGTEMSVLHTVKWGA